MKELWDKYRLLGYDEKTLHKCRNKMDEDNLGTVKQVSLLLIIIIGILTVFYLLFDNDMIRNMVCLFSFAMMLGIYFYSKHLLNDKEKITSGTVNLVINLLSVICFGVGIYLGTFAAGDEMAVPSVWMFFFIILVFNRYPIENLIVLIAACICFIICSYITKRTYIFYYDIIHAITSIIAAVFMSWSKSRMKIENILSMMRLQNANLEIMETVEEQERQAALLRHKASRDELTGMLKKNVFEEKVKEILAGNANQEQYAMVFIDVDNFKQVNDMFGHQYGDILLKEIAGMIDGKSGRNALSARFGGDEFVLFYYKDTDRAQVETHVKEILKSGEKFCDEEGREHGVSLSIGLAFYPEHGKTYSKLFESADKALYRSKEKGKNQYCIY